MRDTSKLQLLAPDLLLGRIPNPCPVSAQRAIAILKILEDGEWHTAGAIASQLGVKPKYVADILRTCKDAWKLASHTRNGWMLPQKYSSIIV
ncbi:MAG: hypothetical protein HWQ38_18995 [Nostoc sp. NMS7]|uniref:hypothetical protein n=1 Tax=Nostoc sp. NMS7 TaxID=2815391 RepID=UPI0025FC8F5B|nr:hypothetical protein [Nostoc sp. NMS7]MBN3948424.1 hypothetical protein [Nostoc sp. NMS7]